jgi:hypothetical protein
MRSRCRKNSTDQSYSSRGHENLAKVLTVARSPFIIGRVSKSNPKADGNFPKLKHNSITDTVEHNCVVQKRISYLEHIVQSKNQKGHSRFPTLSLFPKQFTFQRAVTITLSERSARKSIHDIYRNVRLCAVTPSIHWVD